MNYIYLVDIVYIYFSCFSVGLYIFLKFSICFLYNSIYSRILYIFDDSIQFNSMIRGHATAKWRTETSQTIRGRASAIATCGLAELVCGGRASLDWSHRVKLAETKDVCATVIEKQNVRFPKSNFIYFSFHY